MREGSGFFAALAVRARARGENSSGEKRARQWQHGKTAPREQKQTKRDSTTQARQKKELIDRRAVARFAQPNPQPGIVV